jgi:oligopeptide/dipeptide ABC transporter ATP-binding protein
MTDEFLELDELGVELGGRHLLTSVSFTLANGSSLGIAGETGSGKSMTCRVLTGLLHRVGGRVDRGKAQFLGKDLAHLREQEWQRIRGHEIAFVPQSSLSGLNPVRRIGTQLEEAIRLLDQSNGSTTSRALELLEQVHMAQPAQVLRLYPHELSGGMRQRVMIALALAGRPRLLVADEPTTALDVAVQRGILTLLGEIRRDSGMALILVSHDLAVVQSVAEYVVIMYSGMVVEFGPSDTVLSRPRHPYTRALLDARLLPSGYGKIPTIAGQPPRPEERPPGCPFAPRCKFSAPVCTENVPPLDEVASSHVVACVRAGEIGEMSEGDVSTD